MTFDEWWDNLTTREQNNMDREGAEAAWEFGKLEAAQYVNIVSRVVGRGAGYILLAIQVDPHEERGMSLSERIRPCSEAAPWVVDAVKQLESELAAAYLELRKQSGHVTAIYNRDVWDRAKNALGDSE